MYVSKLKVLTHDNGYEEYDVDLVLDEKYLFYHDGHLAAHIPQDLIYSLAARLDINIINNTNIVDITFVVLKLPRQVWIESEE